MKHQEKNMHEDLKKELVWIIIVINIDKQSNLKIEPSKIKTLYSNRCNDYHNRCNGINRNTIKFYSKKFQSIVTL
jgi:hypothetical protein